MHYCRSQRTTHGEKLLLHKYGYQLVDATKGEEWDIVYGGHEWCDEQINWRPKPETNGTTATSINNSNNNHPESLRLATKTKMNQHGEVIELEAFQAPGINQRLKQHGWHNLQPHQVVHNCPGCKQSYCNKKELCKLLRHVDPKQCYLLPDDGDRVRHDLEHVNPDTLPL